MDGTSVAPSPSASAQRLERRSDFLREDFGLFPCRKMPALLEAVVIDELWVRLLCPTPRGLNDLVRKGTHRDGDGDGFGALPLRSRGTSKHLIHDGSGSLMDRHRGKELE